MSNGHDHRFGGPWTEIKLSTLRKYLQFYTTALKRERFRKIYIDGFAGTGSRTTGAENLSLSMPGSASYALEVVPPFDQYHFIEKHRARVQALRTLCASYPHLNARVYHEEANQKLTQLCQTIDWRGTRAVLFLDPYGLSVKWRTLKAVSATKAIDLWFLFSLSGLYRQAARKYAAMDAAKERSLDECLGTPLWREAFYSDSPQDDLFGAVSRERHGHWKDLLQFVRERLHEQFPKVTDPKILPDTGAPRFALFFACANPSPKAQTLSRKAAEHILHSTR